MPSQKMIFTVYLLLTNSEILYNLNIVPSATHLLSHSLPFLQLQVCGLHNHRPYGQRETNAKRIESYVRQYRPTWVI